MIASLLLAGVALLPAVEQLGDRRFPRREAAHRLLAAAGPVAWPALAGGDDHRCPEVRRRVWLLSEGRREAWVVAEARRLCRGKPFPWLHLSWAGWHSGGSEQSQWMARTYEVAAVIDDGNNDYTRWRVATRLWAESQLRQGVPSMSVAIALRGMVVEERRWHLVYDR